jgi:hypothetical protein
LGLKTERTTLISMLVDLAMKNKYQKRPSGVAEESILTQWV